MIRQALLALIFKDLKLQWRAGGGAGTSLFFFLAVVIVIPFGAGPDPALLSRIGPAILWLAALLAMLFGLDRLFQTDEEDGSLDLLMGSPLPLEIIVLTKAFAHWLATGLPIVLATPFLGALLMVPPSHLVVLALTLLIGTLGLVFLGAIGAAITVSLKRGGLLLALLILPFAIPLMIFGAGAVTSSENSASAVMILSGLSLIFMVSGAFVSAAALRLSAGSS